MTRDDHTLSVMQGAEAGVEQEVRHNWRARLALYRFPRHAKAWLFMLCLLPLARLVGLGFTGGLGVNPIEFVTRSLGTWTLTFLLITLSVTPLRHWTGNGQLIRFRRMLGLFAFFYASLHLISYLWLDQFFDWGEIWRDIVKRPFITVGMLTFALLVPLAATSSDRAVRALRRNWQRLHRLVYPAAMAAVLHYYWLVKQDVTQPIIYAGLLAVLLLDRVIHAQTRRQESARGR